MNVSYAAVRFRQAEEGNWLVLFSAPAVEIDSWVGVPQKLKLGDDETAGFQRTVSEVRLSSLAHFFRNPANVMQNPLLCAIRNAEGVKISFEIETDEGEVQSGRLIIEVPELRSFSLADLFAGVIAYLEERVPTLAERAFPSSLYQRLEQQYRGVAGDEDEEAEEESSEGSEENGEVISDAPLDEELFEESQVSEFWDQLTARHRLAQKLELDDDVSELLGFTREVLEAYLRPVVLVDGQHRLQGALTAAEAAVEEDRAAFDAGLQRIADGEIDADNLQHSLLLAKSRKLPVSLLMDPSSAEHVFQFVVVNQKATPVPKALLATIISTSLAPEELKNIKERLEAADLKLESSQAVSSLARNPASPFADRVARGFDEDSSAKLPWSVLVTLADVFRNLQGAKYYHDSSLDHARIWREKRLEESAIVADWQTRDYPSALA